MDKWISYIVVNMNESLSIALCGDHGDAMLSKVKKTLKKLGLRYTVKRSNRGLVSTIKISSLKNSAEEHKAIIELSGL